MKNIIIIEDDPAILDPMTIILRNAGYSISGFVDGGFILENNYALPDMYIIDKQLNGVDGLDLCKYLKDMPATRNLPVIMISANPHIARLAMDAKADGALEKPFRMKELRELVASHMAG